MNSNVDPLANLQPLHHPAPVSWWPPAPGWWALAVFLLVIIFILGRYFQRRVYKRAALQALKNLEKQDLAAAAYLRELNALLKRYALVCFPDEGVARLTGTAWLQFLQEKSRSSQAEFFQSRGEALVEGVYRDSYGVENEELSRFVRHWISHNLPARQRVSGKLTGYGIFFKRFGRK